MTATLLFCNMQVLNLPQQTGRFNFTTQFPYYKETAFLPDFSTQKLGKPVVFDMDMSAGDILALIYLLKVPVELIDLKVVAHHLPVLRLFLTFQILIYGFFHLDSGFNDIELFPFNLCLVLRNQYMLFRTSSIIFSSNMLAPTYY